MLILKPHGQCVFFTHLISGSDVRISKFMCPSVEAPDASAGKGHYYRYSQNSYITPDTAKLDNKYNLPIRSGAVNFPSSLMVMMDSGKNNNTYSNNSIASKIEDYYSWSYWYYGYSKISFNENNKVSGWDNNGNLKIGN